MSESEESSTREDVIPPAEPTPPAEVPAPENPPTPPAPPAEAKPRDWRAIAIMAGYGLLAILVIWQTVALSRTTKAGAEALKKAEAAKVSALDDARKTGGEHAATALASGLHQMFVLRSQYPEVSDRTFQAVCAELAATQNFDLVIITDSQRRVLAASDLTMVGQTYAEAITGSPTTEKKEGKWTVSAPVKSQEAILGAVVLRLK